MPVYVSNRHLQAATSPYLAALVLLEVERSSREKSGLVVLDRASHKGRTVLLESTKGEGATDGDE